MCAARVIVKHLRSRKNNIIDIPHRERVEGGEKHLDSDFQ